MKIMSVRWSEYLYLPSTKDTRNDFLALVIVSSKIQNLHITQMCFLKSILLNLHFRFYSTKHLKLSYSNAVLTKHNVYSHPSNLIPTVLSSILRCLVPMFYFSYYRVLLVVLLKKTFRW